MFYFARQAAVFDVLANTLGIACVAIVARRFGGQQHRKPAFQISGRLAAAAAIGAAVLIAAWAWPAPRSTIANWDRGFELLLGNETTSDRPWRGTIEALALVPQPLSARERRDLSDLGNADVRTALLQRGAYLLPAPVQLDGGAAKRLPPEAARRLFEEAVRRNALTVIATITTADVRQTGPARIVSFSRDQFNRNLDLGQEARRIAFRIRTPITGANGTEPHTETPAVLEADHPVTVVASTAPSRGFI